MQQDSYINLSSIFLVEKKTICKFSINEISIYFKFSIIQFSEQVFASQLDGIQLQRGAVNTWQTLPADAGTSN